MKVCRTCGLYAPLSEFYANSHSSDGTTNQCKPCARAARRQYGAEHPDRITIANMKCVSGCTPELYAAMLAAQEGGCAVCGTTAPGGRGRFHVDHDHTCCPGAKSCGKCIRGLLCNNCNVGLGHFRDDPSIMVAGIAYLNSPRPQSLIDQHGTSYAKTHCPHGHEFTEDNIYRRSNRPDLRECRTCVLEREAIRRAVPEIREARRLAEQARRDRLKINA